MQGGSFAHDASFTAFVGIGFLPSYEDPYLGFRLVAIPEPSTGLLVGAGLLSLAARGRARGGAGCVR